MWISKREYDQLLDRIEKAESRSREMESRALAAQEMIAAERRERMVDVRHVMSMWLRHQKSFPLPPTTEEKAEIKEQVEQRKQEPIPLTPEYMAMRDANRLDAASRGIPQEEADKTFEQYMVSLVNGEIE